MPQSAKQKEASRRGGYNLAAKLTPAQRRKKAQMMARARWSKHKQQTQAA